MKKFIQIISATILSVGFIGSVAGAVAAPCDSNIDQSGSDNTATSTCTDTTVTIISCVNNIVVGTISTQGAASGDAINSGNVTNGSATTGDAVNYNGTSTTIGATGCNAMVASTPTPSVTPVTPGKGGIEAPAASLPNTAANDTATVIAVSLASAAAIVGLSRAGVAAYRRIGNK